MKYYLLSAVQLMELITMDSQSSVNLSEVHYDDLPDVIDSCYVKVDDHTARRIMEKELGNH